VGGKGIGGGDGGTRRRRTREFGGDGAFCFDKRYGSIFCNATCVSSFSENRFLVAADFLFL
jgi:hypothetical protein